MLRFGYDFYNQENGIEKSNGLIGQKITEKNKDVSNIFQFYLPPYLTEIFNRFDIDFKIDSADNIKNRTLMSGQYLKTKWIYVLDCIGDPRGWLGKYIPESVSAAAAIVILTPDLSKTPFFAMIIE